MTARLHRQGFRDIRSNFIQRIILAVEKPPNFPRLGRKVPEADQDAIRELIYQDYRIIYRISGQPIEILTVLHGRRDLRSFKPEPWEITD